MHVNEYMLALLVCGSVHVCVCACGSVHVCVHVYVCCVCCVCMCQYM